MSVKLSPGMQCEHTWQALQRVLLHGQTSQKDDRGPGCHRDGWDPEGIMSEIQFNGFCFVS